MRTSLYRALTLPALFLSLSGLTFAQNMMLRSYTTGVGGPINRGDFNKDGIPDIVYCGGTVSVVLGHADGTVGTPINSGSGNCQSLAVADFNKDGNQDVVISSLGAATTDVYLGNGDGTFRLFSRLPQDANDLITGDFNNDGKQDVAIANPAGVGGVTIYPGLGNGSFGAPKTIATTIVDLRKILVADFDADGKPDLVLSGYRKLASGQFDTAVEVLFNNGNLQFKDSVIATDNTGLATVGDLDGDNASDIVATQGVGCVDNPKTTVCSWHLKTYLSNKAARTFRVSNDITMPGRLTDAKVEDVNGDGINDIVSLLKGGVWEMAFWKGHTNGAFDATPTVFEFGGDTTSVGLVTLDLNRDGRPDFAVTNAGAFQVGLSVLLNAIPRAGCATYTAESVVTGCQPTNATYVKPSVHFVANGHSNASTVSQLQVYVDNNLLATAPGSHMDLTRTLGTGAHTIIFKQLTSAGAAALNTRAINVYNGTPGTVCSTALSSAKICAPPTAAVNSPVTVFAAGYPSAAPTSVKLYVDGQLKTSVSNLQNYIRTSITLAKGSHTLTFKVFDRLGHVVQATKTISVL